MYVKVCMAIRNYTVSLEEGVVTKAKEITEFYGGKLSPIINNLLTQWIEKERDVKHG